MDKSGQVAVGCYPAADVPRESPPNSIEICRPPKPQLIHPTSNSTINHLADNEKPTTTTTKATAALASSLRNQTISPPFEITVSSSASPSTKQPPSLAPQDLAAADDDDNDDATKTPRGATTANDKTIADTTATDAPSSSSVDEDEDEGSVISDVLNDQQDNKNNNTGAFGSIRKDGGFGSIRKDAPEFTDMGRPMKKQRSVSSLGSSDRSLPSSSDSPHDSMEDDKEDDDSSFDREAKIRSFPISLDEDTSDLSSVIQYPFGELPQSLSDVARFIKSDACQKIVILTGAGMSVVSGIPDFRSANGLYATMDPDRLTATQSERDLMRLDPSFALDNHLFLQNQFPCLEVNRQFLLGTKEQNWKATLAHRFVELLHAKTGKLARLYTQNIDGLEDQCTKLPREKVIPVHGTMDQADCAMCHNEANFEQFCEQVRTKIKDITGTDPTAPAQSSHIRCRICGYNTLKPSIVLFRSSLPQKFFECVPKDVEDADMLIIIGTSLKVAPANSLVYRVPETCLRMLVNRDPVGHKLGMSFDDLADRDFFAEGDIDSSMLDLMDALGWVDDLAPLLDCNGLPESSARLLQVKLQDIKNRTDATSSAEV